MRVISPRRLRDFWATRPRAEAPLRGWMRTVLTADWGSFADLRADFPTADLVGTCTVFNAGGNKYRLIGRVFYASHRVYVLAVLTHAGYDRGDWPAACGCHLPPPPRGSA